MLSFPVSSKSFLAVIETCCITLLFTHLHSVINSYSVKTLFHIYSAFLNVVVQTYKIPYHQLTYNQVTSTFMQILPSFSVVIILHRLVYKR